MFASIAMLVFLPIIVSSFAIASSKPPCKDVSFDITVSADNVAFNPSPDLRNETEVVELVNEMMQMLPSAPAGMSNTARITSTLRVGATFCESQARKPLGVVQVLVHGGMQTKNVWKGWDGLEYYSRKYDYTLVAMEKGFHTLAVNLPGRGLSRPDPLGVIQVPLHAEVLHRVIQAVRSGKTSDKTLRHVARGGVKKIVFVGHALGSAVGNALARSHPDAVDAYVLTGYSAQPAFPRITAEEVGFANKIITRLAQLLKRYMTLKSDKVLEAFFFAGQYESSRVSATVRFQDAMTVGEFATLHLGYRPAPAYRGPILIVAGKDDALSCSTPQRCEAALHGTTALFPNSRQFDSMAVDLTGHAWMQHQSAPRAFEKIHSWLAGAV